MKKFLVCVMLVLLSCQGKREECFPLKGMKSFDVVVFVSPYEEYDAGAVVEIVKKEFSEVGQLVDDGDFQETVVVSLGYLGIKNAGTITAYAPCTVVANGCAVFSEVWRGATGASQEPVVKNGVVSFTKSSKRAQSVEEAVRELALQLGKEYERCNEGKKPVFRLVAKPKRSLLYFLE